MAFSQSVNSSDEQAKPILFVIETLLPGAVWFGMPAHFVDGVYAAEVCSILNGGEPGGFRLKPITDPDEASRIIAECPL